MFEGQYLFNGEDVYSPWMERQGNTIRGSFDIVELSGLELVIQVADKNKEEQGPGTTRAAKLIATTDGGVEVRGWGGLKELVRFRFSTQNGTNDYDYALFRALEPVWYDHVKAN